MSLTLLRQFGVVGLQGAPAAGRRRFGVPPGGAFDLESLALANAVAGFGEGAPMWELSMAQATFRADCPGVVCAVGAVAAIRAGSESFETNSAFSVATGSEFVVEAPTVGSRVYVAFGPSLRQPGWRIKLDSAPDSVLHRSVLRVVAGPQAGQFDSRVLSWPFTVSRTGNRVGIRLEESVGPHQVELPSEPQCVGTVQVSNDGTPILLGPDGPTIGGYPKIAVVATCDIPRIAQLQPGDSVRFEPVSLEAARQALQDARHRLHRRLRLLRLSTA